MEQAKQPVVREACWQANCTALEQNPSRDQPKNGSASALSLQRMPTRPTFVQLKPREKVSLSIDGKAVLISGSTIFMHCPQRHHHKDRVKWTKNELIIETRGRVKLTETGVLRIRGSRSSDAGIYYCSAGGVKTNISVVFQSVEEAAEMFASRRNSAPNWTIDRGEGSGSEEDSQEQKQDDSIAIYASADVINQQLDNKSTLGVFVVGDWTPCSMLCGDKGGNQHRNVSCEILSDDYTLIVDEAYCSRDGLITRPTTVRGCEDTECPQWSAGPWSQVDLNYL